MAWKAVAIGYRIPRLSLAPPIPASRAVKFGDGRRPAWERRVTGAAIAAIAVVLASSRLPFGRMSALDWKRHGMELFSQGDVSGSLEQFNKVLDAFPEELPYLWQRGLSLFYLDRFEEGAAQFREDTKLGNNDSEEALWCFLCEARSYSLEEARQRIPDTGKDSRAYMNQIYKLYKQGGDPQQMLASFLKEDRGQASFYASLYAGLYYEASGEFEPAKSAIMSACGSSYGSTSQDYMVSVAKVHCKTRKWC
ncbi:uncharacterized protein LOC9655142 isoform X1 [Selaginella moellendorffii]|uniref:uncharacterized protein LOC9655142 isoform X1 n=1 Tax=Selaginella moellendorffii TaxID=88036 RepID=UPI000D1CEDE6|nr:uncharacterized protein LOC9655142 isoform X1 [Selaginella moellendorffii]|eukprot:XP_024524094.1 uncharacterized protein LOC9655142 isoform X1 [Selaginella moellendorffii]